jgi:hypothetical protein
MTRTDADQCRHRDLASPADDPVRAPPAITAPWAIPSSPRPRDRMGPHHPRSFCSAPPGALLTRWPRDKRERRRPSCAAFGLRPNTQHYAQSTASCVIAITAIAD